MELYYAIVNILDYLAKHKNLTEEKRMELYFILNKLLTTSGETIEDIANANDCGGCKTWIEIVDRFRELYTSGERV